jgi:hypothetical protein
LTASLVFLVGFGLGLAVAFFVDWLLGVRDEAR